MKKYQILYIIMFISLIVGLLSNDLLQVVFLGWFIYAIIESLN